MRHVGVANSTRQLIFAQRLPRAIHFPSLKSVYGVLAQARIQ
jgi:hypothetical protein